MHPAHGAQQATYRIRRLSRELFQQMQSQADYHCLMAMEPATGPVSSPRRAWRLTKKIAGIAVMVVLSALGGFGVALGLLSSSAPK